MPEKNPEDASQDYQHLPSFAPRSTKRTFPSFTPEQHQAPLSQSAPSQPAQSKPLPAFTPAARRDNERIPQSFAPHSDKQYRQHHTPATLHPTRNVASLNTNKPHVDVMEPSHGINAISRPRRKHRFAAIFFSIVAVFLVIAMCLGFMAWQWVDSRMQKEPWLTNSIDTPAETWLILGSDQRKGEEAKTITGFRTDTILVLTKPTNGHSSLISIPRDSLVTVNNQQMKINAVAQVCGKQCLTQAVENITGQRIDHVAELRFDGLKNVVNALGGITLCYDRTVRDQFSGLNWTAGCHEANGDVALAFARMRYADPQSDFGRTARQRMVIGAIMKKATSQKTLTNVGTVKKLAETGLASLTVDEHANPASLWSMAQAFKDATSAQGTTGTVYWTDPSYQVPGVGSSILLDDAKNLQLFKDLSAGTQQPGMVGSLHF